MKSNQSKGKGRILITGHVGRDMTAMCWKELHPVTVAKSYRDISTGLFLWTIDEMVYVVSNSFSHCEDFIILTHVKLFPNNIIETTR